MSRNEWEVAETSHGSEDQIYVVLRVVDVGTGSPKVQELLVDPVAMADAGLLRLSPKQGWWVDSPALDPDAGASE